MGHKYQIGAAVESVERLLSQRYSKDFSVARSQFDAQSTQVLARPFPGAQNIGVVNIARLLDLPDVLPAAFMHCCTLEPKDLLAGFEHDGIYEHLSPEDTARVLVARTELVQLQAQVFVSVSAGGNSMECFGLDGCDTLCDDVLKEAARRSRPVFSANWTASFMDFRSDMLSFICDPCMNKIKTKETSLWKAFWDAWPLTLGL